MMRKLAGCFGVLMALVSAPLFTRALLDAFAGDDFSTNIMLGVFFGGTLAVGAIVAKRMFGAPPPRAQIPPAMLEQQILGHAASMGGRITVPELALMSGLPVDDAVAALESLAKKGIADVMVTDKGATVYDFPGLLTLNERKGARGLLER